MSARVSAAALFDGRRYWPGPWTVTLASGRLRAIRRGRAPGARDLGEALLMPGFHDAHTHLLGAALGDADLELSGATSLEALQAALAGAVRGLSEGEWVLGRGWSAERLGRPPQPAELDAAAPGVPIVLMGHDGHSAVASSPALAELAARGVAPDADGVLREAAAFAALRAAPLRAVEAQAALLRARLDVLPSLGITGLQDDTSYDGRLRPREVYPRACGGRRRVRVWLWRAYDDLARRMPDAASGWLREGARKLYLDGSFGSRSAWLREPYAEPGAGRGQANLSEAALREGLRAAHAAGFQVAVHCIGDAALAACLSAFEAAAPLAALRRRRHRIEHIQLASDEDLAGLARLGIAASIQPAHRLDDALLAQRILGDERWRRSYPFTPLWHCAGAVALGSDAPIAALDPWRGVAAAVARQAEEAPELPRVEGLRRALSAATWGAAWAAHAEREVGRLAPGWRADLTALAPDPFVADAARPEVRWTAFGGETVFER